MSFENELGVLPPVGFFDPLGYLYKALRFYLIFPISSGLSKGIDELRFYDWRAAEIKHGRVAMAAVTGMLSAFIGYIHVSYVLLVGYIFQETARFPGYIYPGTGLKFSDVPNGVAALGTIPFIVW